MNRFVLKSLINAAVVAPLLVWLSDATWLGSIAAALVLSTIAYLVGDQMILRATNNLTATFADAGLTFAYLWVLAVWFDWTLDLGEILMIAAVLGVVEFFFHRYLGVRDRGGTPAA